MKDPCNVICNHLRSLCLLKNLRLNTLPLRAHGSGLFCKSSSREHEQNRLLYKREGSRSWGEPGRFCKKILSKPNSRPLRMWILRDFLSIALFRTSTNGWLCNSLCQRTIIPSLPKHFPPESSIGGGAYAARTLALSARSPANRGHVWICVLCDYEVAGGFLLPLLYRHDCESGIDSQVAASR